MTVWDEIDERVLRWLAREGLPSLRPWQLILTVRPDQTSEEIPGLTDRQVDDALQRLESHGLVDARDRSETSATVRYATPRVTALGHHVLGLWPDLDQVTALTAIQLALQAVASDAQPEERPALWRAVGIVGEIGGAIIANVTATTMEEMGTGS